MQTYQVAGTDRLEALEPKAFVFDIQRFSVQDGPGIRTTVFFKGCPLTCLWCSNPESQRQAPELLYRANLCTQCHQCVDTCPTKAIQILDDGSLETNRDICSGCGTCEAVCLNDARRITGTLMPLDEVMEIVLKDVDYYRNSGGGMTASGGEPTSQPAFLTALFERCQRQGLHTTLDSCGYVPSEILGPILKHVDLVLFDIKAIDDQLHQELTGASNEIILQNARLVASRNTPLIIRVPLITGCNATLKNIQDTAQFARELGDIEVNLLPYHRLGLGKYEALGMRYKLEEAEALESSLAESLADEVGKHGVPVKIIY